VFPIQLPALRERADDIPLLAWHFVKKYGRRMNRQVDRIRPEDMHALVHHSWAGNVRELQNVIERSVVGSCRGVLELAPLLANCHALRTVLRQTLLRWRTRNATALRQTEWVIGGQHGAAVGREAHYPIVQNASAPHLPSNKRTVTHMKIIHSHT
jgi:formate hydrogenlyase transcriptional activator